MDTDSYRLLVRRLDGGWHVIAQDHVDDLEMVHERSFLQKKRAYALRERIGRALEDGRDLNLAHWSLFRSQVLGGSREVGPLQLDQRTRWRR